MITTSQPPTSSRSALKTALRPIITFSIVMLASQLSTALAEPSYSVRAGDVSNQGPAPVTATSSNGIGSAGAGLTTLSVSGGGSGQLGIDHISQFNFADAEAKYEDTRFLLDPVEAGVAGVLSYSVSGLGNNDSIVSIGGPGYPFIIPYVSMSRSVSAQVNQTNLTDGSGSIPINFAEDFSVYIRGDAGVGMAGDFVHESFVGNIYSSSFSAGLTYSIQLNEDRRHWDVDAGGAIVTGADAQWAEQAAPGATSYAAFNSTEARTLAVNLDANRTYRGLIMDGETVDLNLAGHLLTLGSSGDSQKSYNILVGEGRDTPSDLTLRNGTVTTTKNIIVGGTSKHNATLTLTQDAEFTAENGTLSVGPHGIGLLELLAAGKLTTDEPVTLGASASGDGRLTVSGANSRLNVTNLGSGQSELKAGDAGASQIQISAGGVVNAPLVRMAKAATSTSTLAVTGTDSRLQTALLKIAENGNASATVSSGGRIQTSILEMAINAGAEGTLTIGSGGVLELGGGISKVGEGGRATLEVEAGGTIVGDASIIQVGSGNLALASTLRVTGVGASLQDVAVGAAEGGLFHLRDGAVLGSPSERGNLSAQGGRVIIQNAEAYTIFPSAQGEGPNQIRGVIDVLSGGKLSAQNINVFENGRLNVNGTGAELRDFNVFLLRGILNVSNGGQVFGETAGGAITGTIGMHSGAVIEGGNGAIHANILMPNGSIIRPGNSPGVLTINGDLELEAGAQIELEIGGLTPGEDYDQLIVNGDFDIQTGSGIEFSFINGFAPQAGQTFSLFDVGGAFTNNAGLTFSGLEPGWLYDALFDPETGSFEVTSLNNGIAIVPEPATTSLFAAALFAAASLRMRRRLGFKI